MHKSKDTFISPKGRLIHNAKHKTGFNWEWQIIGVRQLENKKLILKCFDNGNIL